MANPSIKINDTLVFEQASGVSKLSNNVTIDSGVTFPAGSVLQVKDVYLKDKFDYTNGSSWTFGTAATREDQSHGGVVDDLSLTLTTKGTNSSFFISLHLSQCSNSDMDGGYHMAGGIFYSIDSYANPLSRGNADGSRTRVSFGNWTRTGTGDFCSFDMGCQLGHTSTLAKGATLSYRTVLATTYTSGGNTIRINSENNDSNGTSYFRPVSTFRVMEIAT